MELIQAYADKVASYLPKSIRVETADELYDSLCEKFEHEYDQAQADAESAFLGQQLHPIKMATQLGENEKLYIIGPAFYLSFIEAIKITAVIVAVIQLTFFGLNFFGDTGFVQNIFQSVSSFIDMYLTATILIGLIFVALEKSGERTEWLDTWKISDLSTHVKEKKLSKVEALFELNISAIGLLWLTGVFDLPSVIQGEGNWLIEIVANLPLLLFWAIIGMLVVDILLAIFKLLRGYWTKHLRIFTLVTNVVWIALLGLVLQQGPLVTQANLEGVPNVDAVLASINTGIDIALAVVIIIVSWEALTQAYRLITKN